MKNVRKLLLCLAVTLGTLLALNGCTSDKAGEKTDESKAAETTVASTQKETTAAAKTEETNAAEKADDLKWELIVEKSQIDGQVFIGSFADDTHGITVGYGGEVHYTEDGGKTWPRANNTSWCRYGLSIVNDKVAASCGNGGQLRISTDSGKNWIDGGVFLDKNYFVSFVDEKTGWVADRQKLGCTVDGGKTYKEIPLPTDIKSVATIHAVNADSGYVLNRFGLLYITKDGGKTWSSQNILPADKKIKIVVGTSQSSAVRFTDDKNGVVAMAGEDGKRLIYRTTDGGATWIEEKYPKTEAGFGITISPDGKYITITGISNTVSVLKYKS